VVFEMSARDRHTDSRHSKTLIAFLRTDNAVVVCLSVRPSVRPSHAGTIPILNG